jgi:hypothetical protein
MDIIFSKFWKPEDKMSEDFSLFGLQMAKLLSCCVTSHGLSCVLVTPSYMDISPIGLQLP